MRGRQPRTTSTRLRAEASSRNLTDANGNPQLVTGSNLANLGTSLRNLKGFDNQGRAIPVLGGAGDATVNSVLNDIGGKLQDQDPVAGNNMRASLAAHQSALQQPEYSASDAPHPSEPDRRAQPEHRRQSGGFVRHAQAHQDRHADSGARRRLCLGPGRRHAARRARRSL